MLFNFFLIKPEAGNIPMIFLAKACINANFLNAIP